MIDGCITVFLAFLLLSPAAFSAHAQTAAGDGPCPDTDGSGRRAMAKLAPWVIRHTDDAAEA